jgi:MtN3 and saliva related transmembrane protein
MIDFIGFFAASLTTLSFIPQAVLVVRTGNTQGVSLLMYTLFTIGVSGWLIYGVLTSALPIILSNSVTLCLALIILNLKLRDVFNARSQASAHGATRATSAPM